MKCKNCGFDLPDGSYVCPNCGFHEKEAQPQVEFEQPNQLSKQYQKKNARCLPAFILGLIGSLFGLFGGICTTMCSSAFSSKAGNSAFIMIIGGSVIGLIGACLCLNKSKIGSLLELGGALLIIIRAFSKYGADFMTVIALLSLLLGGIVGFIFAYLIPHKAGNNENSNNTMN